MNILDSRLSRRVYANILFLKRSIERKFRRPSPKKIGESALSRLAAVSIVARLKMVRLGGEAACMRAWARAHVMAAPLDVRRQGRYRRRAEHWKSLPSTTLPWRAICRMEPWIRPLAPGAK
jgi:hypothetical protein